MKRLLITPNSDQVYNILEEVDKSPLALEVTPETMPPSENKLVPSFVEQLRLKTRTTTKRRPSLLRKSAPPIPGTNQGRWTEEEKQRFNEGVQLYSHDWDKVASHVRTRTSAQVRSHNQKQVLSKKKAKIGTNANQLYNYLRRRSAAAVVAGLNSEQKSVNDLVIDPELKVVLKDVLEQFAINGTIVLSIDTMKYAMKKMNHDTTIEKEMAWMERPEENPHNIIPLRGIEGGSIGDFATDSQT